MRIAVIADIHGNLPALNAALAHIDKLNIDCVVVAGDIVVGLPDSLACWQRVKSLGCPVLRGNHERYVCDFGTGRAGTGWDTPQFGPVRWAVEDLGREARAELAVLPATLRLPEAPDVLFVHGSARNDTDPVFPHTTDAELEPMFAASSERWLVRGHNHCAGVRLWGERRIVTAGSVGLPLDGVPSAQFAIMESAGGGWSVQHHSVRYDVGAAVRRFHETGYLERAGPMAQLFLREVETASSHIVPFISWQKERVACGEPSLSLSEAVDRFLRR